MPRGKEGVAFTIAGERATYTEEVWSHPSEVIQQTLETLHETLEAPPGYTPNLPLWKAREVCRLLHGQDLEEWEGPERPAPEGVDY